MAMNAPKHMAVIGGGISGLAAALRMTERAPAVAVTLFESAERPGGVIDTVARDGCLYECSADGFITAVPWGIDFCRRVGLGDDLLATDATRRRAFVVFQGRLEPVPEGFIIMAPRDIGAVLKSRVLSPWGKLRMAAEWALPPRPPAGDESVGHFVTRRLGREVYERLVQPLIGGIYTADPMALSLAATMPQFQRMEREHGGLIRGARRGRGAAGGEGAGGARYSLFTAPRGGMRCLVDAVVARLPPATLRLGTPVRGLRRATDGRWAVATAGGETFFDGVIVATPAPAAAALLRDDHPELARELDAIVYAGTTIVSVCYRREHIRHALDGFGFVTPFRENRAIIAASFLSQKYAGRAPADRVLIRVFVGGARRPDLVEASEDQLGRIVHGELADLLGITGAPLDMHLARWPRRMPQYQVGHGDRVARIEHAVAQRPGLALAGSAYRGVGIPYCIRSGEQAADALLSP